MRLFWIIIFSLILSCTSLKEKPRVYRTKVSWTKYFQTLSLFQNEFYMTRRYVSLVPIVDSGTYQRMGDTILFIYDLGPSDLNWWPFTKDSLKAIVRMGRLEFMTLTYQDDNRNIMRRVHSRHKRKYIVNRQRELIGERLKSGR